MRIHADEADDDSMSWYIICSLRTFDMRCVTTGRRAPSYLRGCSGVGSAHAPDDKLLHRRAVTR